MSAKKKICEHCGWKSYENREALNKLKIQGVKYSLPDHNLCETIEQGIWDTLEPRTNLDSCEPNINNSSRDGGKENKAKETFEC